MSTAATADFKADARAGRLSNTLTERVFREWQALAVRACDPAVRAYWVCRQEAGLLVVVRCRGENEAMQRCVAEHTRDAPALDAFRTRRLAELAEESAAAAAARRAAGARRAAEADAAAKR